MYRCLLHRVWSLMTVSACGNYHGPVLAQAITIVFVLDNPTTS